MRGVGRAVFAAILLLIAGTLNIIYGFAAIGDAHFFTDSGSHYVFSSLHGWGWITVILGVIQLIAGFSLLRGGTFGRVIGIIARQPRRHRRPAVHRRRLPVLVAGDLRALRDRDPRPHRVRRAPPGRAGGPRT